MKTFVRFLVILSALSLIVFFAILFTLYNSGAAKREVVKEKTFGIEFNAIDIAVENVHVDFLPSKYDTTRIKLIGDSENLTLNTTISGNRLLISIEEQSRFLSFGFTPAYSLQVYIPASGIGSISVDSRNGTIQASKIKAAEMSLEAENGRITVEEVDSDVIHVETVNGIIELTRIDAAITARSSNGRIRFSDVFGDLTAQTTNGRIELATDTLNFPIDFKTNNGRIEIHTENEPANASIQAHVDNGRLDIFGQNSDQVSFGNNGVLIKLSSKNGRIIVD